jgi:hypothetical protein
MRVKFGHHIDECKRVTHRENSDMLIITTVFDALYTVCANSKEEANEAYVKLLVEGYFDASNCEYSN